MYLFRTRGSSTFFEKTSFSAENFGRTQEYRTEYSSAFFEKP